MPVQHCLRGIFLKEWRCMPTAFIFLRTLLLLLLGVAMALPPSTVAKESIPDLSGNYLGVYFYGFGFERERQGQMVHFRLKLVQDEGDSTFTGEIDEEYTDFGTPKNNRLRATVVGEFSQQGGVLKMRLQKTYRYFDQDSVTYRGVWDAERNSFDGKFSFASATAQGVFTLQKQTE